MVDPEDKFSEEVTRVPTREDLVRICRALNDKHAHYVVVGGTAMIEAGLLRTTHGVDLLVDASDENVGKVCDALTVLSDQASRDVASDDVRNYTVVRINDEFTVDLMGKACGLSYQDAVEDIVWKDFDGVLIPFASLQLLWKTKQTYREKDALDRSFLRKLFADRGIEPPSP
ncbi:MAG TPA: hypothetical protein PKE55_06240 [Kiritimatiellia bacterium]|nr:hypothetical protein [Kiritimatiellia bacterium]